MVYTKEHVQSKLDKENTEELTYRFGRCRTDLDINTWLVKFKVNIDEYLDACELYNLSPDMDVLFRGISETVAKTRKDRV